MTHHSTNSTQTYTRLAHARPARLGAAVCGLLLAIMPAIAHAETSTDASTSAASGFAPPRSFALSAKAGVLTSSEIYVDDVSLDSDVGPLMVAKLDTFIVPRASLGVQGILAFPKLADEGVTLLNAGATLKLHYEIGSVRLCPGLALSYQRISSEYFDAVEGFSPGAFVELGVPFARHSSGVVEVGFLSQPNGGNEDSTVTFGPTWYLAFGAELGS